MKRFIYATLLLIALILSGCSNEKTPATTTAKELNVFPFEGLKYVDDTFSLTSVNAYCKKSKSGHGYCTYLVIRYDISSMSDDGKYWMLKDISDIGLIHTFNNNVYLDCEENDVDFKMMSLQDSEITDDYIYLVYGSDEERYEFTSENTEFTISLRVYQTDNVTGDTFERTWYVNKSFGEISIPMLDAEGFTSDTIKSGHGMELNK